MTQTERDLLEALRAVLARAEKEFQTLTSGEFGKFADFDEASRALNLIRRLERKTKTNQ